MKILKIKLAYDCNLFYMFNYFRIRCFPCSPLLKSIKVLFSEIMAACLVLPMLLPRLSTEWCIGLWEISWTLYVLQEARMMLTWFYLYFWFLRSHIALVGCYSANTKLWGPQTTSLYSLQLSLETLFY